MEKTAVSCLFLCAGRSSRMEGANKLLMPFDATSVLAHSVTQIARAGFSEIVAVTGFEAALVEEEIARNQTEAEIQIVRNDDYAVGMHSSIRKGLARLSNRAQFFAVCLADQPLLTASDYAYLIASAREVSSAKIIAPLYAGVRGNPTFISMSLREEVLTHEDSDRGCSYLFERYPTQVYYVEMPHAQRNLDVDTRELLREAELLCTPMEVLDASAT